MSTKCNYPKNETFEQNYFALEIRRHFRYKFISKHYLVLAELPSFSSLNFFNIASSRVKDLPD